MTINSFSNITRTQFVQFLVINMGLLLCGGTTVLFTVTTSSTATTTVCTIRD